MPFENIFAPAEAGLKDTVNLLVADMEQLELPDGSANVVISNCVINLCPDKEAVYREAFRILRPGGRLAISDIVYTERVAPRVQEHFQSPWAGCVGGAIDEESYIVHFRIKSRLSSSRCNILCD